MRFLKEEITKSKLSGIYVRNGENETNDSGHETNQGTFEHDLDNSFETTVENNGDDPETSTQTDQPPNSTCVQVPRKRKESVKETVAQKLLE